MVAVVVLFSVEESNVVEQVVFPRRLLPPAMLLQDIQDLQLPELLGPVHGSPGRGAGLGGVDGYIGTYRYVVCFSNWLGKKHVFPGES